MAYTLYVTRKADGWAGETDPAAITRPEWQHYVAHDPEMRPNDCARDPLCAGAQAGGEAGADPAYENYLEGLAAWLGRPGQNRAGEYAWFSHQGGQVVVEDPDEEVLGKALAIARALHARVRGADGEYFDEVDPVFGPRPEADPLAWETSDFRDFQTFAAPEAARPLLAALGEQGIDYRTTLDTGQPAFDPSFANNRLTTKFVVKLRPADFERGNQAVADLYAQALRHISPDHYLLSFTEAELCDILARPDEWSALDVALAGQLLRQRGHDLSAATVQVLRQHRTAELARPDERYPAWIWGGYLLALAGGVGGILLGYQLRFGRKQLPDGRRVFAHSPDDRTHGLRIMALGTLMFLLALTLRLTR